MKKNNDLFKLTIDLPLESMKKIDEMCAHRMSHRLSGRFKRDVVIDAIDLMSHCYKNGDVKIGADL